jgi:hypothetical protein
VPGQPSSIGARVGQHDPAADRRCIPSPGTPDPARQPAVAIDLADERLHVDQLGLELDDEQHPPLRVPRQHVDDAPLAVDGRRDLRRGDPARRSDEQPSDRLVHRRVARAHQSVEIAAPPAGDKVDTHLERRRDLAHGRDRQLTHIATLEPRDRRLPDAGCVREIHLAPASLDSHRAEHATESLVVRAPIMAPGTYLAVSHVSGPDCGDTSGRRRLSYPQPPHVDHGSSGANRGLLAGGSVMPHLVVTSGDRAVQRPLTATGEHHIGPHDTIR